MTDITDNIVKELEYADTMPENDYILISGKDFTSIGCTWGILHTATGMVLPVLRSKEALEILKMVREGADPDEWYRKVLV